MNCIMPLKGHMDITYSVKCVAVESERIFGDVFLTQQTPKFIPRLDTNGGAFYSMTKKKARNLTHQVLETPDFMALNRKAPYGKRRSVPFAETTRRGLQRSQSLENKPNEKVLVVDCGDADAGQSFGYSKRHKSYPSPSVNESMNREVVVTSLVDQLLLDIYGLPGGDRGRSESDSTTSSSRPRPQHRHLQRTRLLAKNARELRILVGNLREYINHAGGLLIRHLRRRDYLIAKRDKQYDVVTAHLQARSEKRSEDTRMRFSLAPQPGESGFTQWLDAMKMVARLPGGIPSEFRKRLWLTLAERHLQQRGVDWRQAEKLCFNEWSNPDDEELGIQIVKDLHRTGCSLFCGAAGRDNQAVLRRVLLGFARWNKSVGYCQGLNVLAALVLQVVDRAEAAAVKVMIYLIEGVLPEGYFADNLRGLSVDMAVFRDLLRMRLPKLSRHLEALQTDAKDKATGSSYEPPLTNVFTMQWFLTLFCHCLPQEAVLRVWDLIFLEGDEVLLRTALSIWEGLADRIMTVTSADEFYSIMGVLTREMLEFTDTNNLVKAIVSTGPLSGVTSLREHHRYNITPWARRLSDDDDTDTEEDERLAVAAAMFAMPQRGKKDRGTSVLSSLQTVAAGSDRDRLALDISTLKQQYAKLRERQRQAHIILSAACARQSMVVPPSQAMNHLLVGKSALVSGKGRQLGPPPGAVPPRTKSSAPYSQRNQNRKDKQGVTLHWKDTKKRKEDKNEASDEGPPTIAVVSAPEEMSLTVTAPKRANVDSDSDSTSTELCDEPDRLSDIDSEEPTSTSDCYVMATDDEKSPRAGCSPRSGNTPLRSPHDSKNESKGRKTWSGGQDVKSLGTERAEDFSDIDETSFAEITDQIRRLSADNEVVAQLDDKLGDNATTVLPHASHQTQSEEQYRSESVNRRQSDDESVAFFDKYGDSSTNSKVVEEPSQFPDCLNFLDVSSSEDNTKGRLMPSQTKVPSDDSPIADITKTDSSDPTKSEFSNKLDALYSSGSPANAEYVGGSTNLNFDKTLVDLDSKVPHFETSLAACSVVSADESNEEESRDAASFSKKVEGTVAETAPYTRSYVIGHLPISPVTVDQKLSKMAEISPQIGRRLVNIGRTAEEQPVGTFLGKQENGVAVRIDRSFDSVNDAVSSLSYEHEACKPVKTYLDKNQSPKTPGSEKSFSSGETMGPDSKTSSLTVSPRTPIRSASPDFRLEKSGCSSVSSDSKTLTIHSIDSDDVKSRTRLELKKPSFEKSSPSTPISTDSLKNKSDMSPKLVVSNSSDSYSPDRKKSSEKSFSSDLQSPISANSIKYTSTCKGGHENLSDSPIDLSYATSPFYPIVHPNQKTPSPYGSTKQKSGTDSTETSPEQRSTSSKESLKLPIYKSPDDYVKAVESKDKEIESHSFGKAYKYDLESPFLAESTKSKSGKGADLQGMDYSKLYLKKFEDEELHDRYTDKDTVSPLPREKPEKRLIFSDKGGTFQKENEANTEKLYIRKDYTKPFERSSSSLDRRFADLKLSASSDEFGTNCVKKRSSDILEDLRHLEAKTSSEGTSETSLLTKKTNDILEDLKSLEARRQDTFSDSASGFSKCRLDDLYANILDVARKSYVIEPKIDIEEGSDSILKSFTRGTDDTETGGDKEPKLGVWTKVKPRKKSDNGRRSSDRALKIIQENSAILHRILTCQAKKRLPDLEEISKEITISPINEEISKIFSPILEKIGLNEHEINEELSRLNFKDLDQMSVTSGSEFDAKINDELSKLSLIDDSEEVDHLDLDEALSRDYLDTREALIDRQINEELSKLLANYDERSAENITRQEKCSSSQNASDLEGLDLSSISTNVFSHKSSNDSIETKSELESIPEPIMNAEKLYQYKESVLPYAPPKYNLPDISPKSDIDIYRELEKLDKISAGEMIPAVPKVVASKVVSPAPYVPDVLPYRDRSSPTLNYTSKPEKPFVSSPLKSPYDSYKPYDFKSRISPRKIPGNPYSVRSYEKPTVDLTFEFSEQKSAPSLHIYDLSPQRPVLSKETLEFRVRYDDELPQPSRDEDLTLRPFQMDLVDLNEGASYYDNNITAPTKYLPKDERGLDKSIPSPNEYKYGKSEFYHRKYESASPQEYSYPMGLGYERQSYSKLPSPGMEIDFESHLAMRRRESHSLSPNHQYADRKVPLPASSYISKLSPSLEDVTKRPVSHPEFPDKINASKYSGLTSQGSNNYRKSSLSLGNVGNAAQVAGQGFQKTPSPNFSPFPLRNTARQPKQLGLKLGLYSPTSPGSGQLKRS